ncbi:MAG: hypothetical protein Q8O05_07985 [Chloroflexota bacterium]|nr:hypothetical protein [Chloroflexota bacterium]
MDIPEMATDGKLFKFIKDYGDDQVCLLELLLFMGRHPSTRFSRLAIEQVLKSRKVYVEKALNYLVSRGVINRHDGRSVPVYSLGQDDSLRRSVSAMARLDWWQRQSLLRQIYPLCSPA